MSIELNRQKQALAKKVLGEFTHRFPTLVNIIDNDLNAATWHLIERFMDSIGGRFLFSEELIADVKVLATPSDTNLDSVKLPDDMICLIRDERLRAYELYCEAKLANALQEHSKVKAVRDTTDPIEASEKSDRIITCLIQELLNIRHPKAYVDVKPNKVGFSDTYIELMQEERLRARELYLNHKNAEAYLERNGWERVKPAKAPQRNDSFPSMDGYEAWIEGGRTLDSAYEFIIAIASPHATAQIIQDGFWLEITGPGKVFIGWMRFVHLSNIKQKALFVVSEFRFPCECAPDEKQVLCPSLIPEKWGNGYKKSVL